MVKGAKKIKRIAVAESSAQQQTRKAHDKPHFSLLKLSAPKRGKNSKKAVAAPSLAPTAPNKSVATVKFDEDLEMPEKSALKFQAILDFVASQPSGSRLQALVNDFNELNSGTSIDMDKSGNTGIFRVELDIHHRLLLTQISLSLNDIKHDIVLACRFRSEHSMEREYQKLGNAASRIEQGEIFTGKEPFTVLRGPLVDFKDPCN